MHHPVRVGTCGWSYKEWARVFYPERLPAGEWLSHFRSPPVRKQ